LPTQNECGANEGKKGECLKQAGEVLSCTAPGYSAPLQKREEDCHGRRNRHRFAAECREKRARKFTDNQ
jgi:hypothetical protein